MTPGGASLRVALVDVDARAGDAVARLASGLRSLGHTPTIIEGVRVPRLVETSLSTRGFVPSLARIPSALASLSSRRHDVAHVFSAVDAEAALAWRRVTGRPVVFTCVEPPSRATIANRRGRLRMTERAFGDVDAVAAADSSTRAAIERLLALDVPEIGIDDVVAYVDLYASCLADRGAGRG